MMFNTTVSWAACDFYREYRYHLVESSLEKTTSVPSSLSNVDVECIYMRIPFFLSKGCDLDSFAHLKTAASFLPARCRCLR